LEFPGEIFRHDWGVNVAQALVGSNNRRSRTFRVETEECLPKGKTPICAMLAPPRYGGQQTGRYLYRYHMTSGLKERDRLQILVVTSPPLISSCVQRSVKQPSLFNDVTRRRFFFLQDALVDQAPQPCLGLGVCQVQRSSDLVVFHGLVQQSRNLIPHYCK
jgi:hypothetical protein